MRFTRLLFWLSDVCAWILLSIALALACLFLILGPVADQMEHQQTYWPQIVKAVGILLMVAGACFGITRRRPLAVLLLAAIAFAVGASASMVTGLLYAGTVLLIFGLPLLLVLFEVRSRLAGKEA